MVTGGREPYLTGIQFITVAQVTFLPHFGVDLLRLMDTSEHLYGLVVGILDVLFSAL